MGRSRDPGWRPGARQPIDLISGSRLGIVIPLLPRDAVESVDTRPTPAVTVGDLDLIAHVPGITSLPRSMPERRIASAGAAREEIARALDLVLAGV